MVNTTFNEIGSIIIKSRRLFLGIIVGLAAVSVLFTFFAPEIYQGYMSFVFPARQSPMGITAPPSKEIISPFAPLMGTDNINSIYKILRDRIFKTTLLENLEASGEKRNVDIDLKMNKSGLYSVYVYDSDPERALRVAEIYLSTINEIYRDISMKTLRSNSKFVETELGKFNDLLDEAEHNLSEFMKMNGIAQLPRETQILIDQKFNIEHSLSLAEIRLKKLETKEKSLRRELKDAEINIKEFQISENPIVLQLKKELVSSEIQLQTFRQRYAPDHPDLQELEVMVEELKVMIMEELDKVISTYTDGLNPIHQTLSSKLIDALVDQEATKAEIEAITARIEEMRDLIYMNPETYMELTRYERERTKYKQIVNSLEAHLAEAELQLIRDFETFVMISPPSVSAKPKFPSTTINVFVSIILGLIVSFLISIYLASREKIHPMFLPEEIIYIPSERAEVDE